ncbi:VOC family protein [Ruania zhangjianzhongii]|uniref:VOC family protein n=1 Tax=Ruania zhangjianzhongii TaxID=2603206 RepID=UPI0011C8444A|nr:VOC family protein [Ruania zhangjianzhongii]
MPIELDHLVYAGPDLAALVAQVRTSTGIAPQPGGSHEGRGTANALLGLGAGRYLELLGPDPDQGDPDRPRPLRVDEVSAPTVVGWAVRTPSVDHLVDSARADGYDPGPVAPMSRRTPDGDLLSWRLTPPEGGFDGAVPFLIDWQDSPHPAEGLPTVSLNEVVIAHPQVTDVRTALTAVGAFDLIRLEHGDTFRMRIVLDTPDGQVTLG